MATIVHRVWNGTTWVDSVTPPTAGPVDWVDIVNKPSSFPPASHLHPPADITGLASYQIAAGALPAGDVMRAAYTAARPTTRTDIRVLWDSPGGAVPSAAITGDWVISGTTGTATISIVA